MPRQVSTGPHAITTSPSLVNCPRCHRPVMAATVAGLDEHIDTAALNEVGELVALCEGRATFELRRDYLMHRDPSKIRYGKRDAPVLARHVCRDTPAEHIERAWEAAGAAFVIQAIGGVVINSDSVA